MANIVLTNSAKFTPYTFDEMLKPLAMATQEYNAIEEGIAELGSKADLMRMYANEEPNSKVASMYNTYANDLDKQAESLAKHGLNPASRKGLLDLKRRYSSEITPIETAVTRRRQLAEEQRKAILSNPSLMYDKYFSTASLDDIMNNPEVGYTPISGNELYAKGAAAAKAASLRNLSFDDKKALSNQYFELTKRRGYSATEAAQFLADSYSIPELGNIIDRIKLESGTDILGYKDRRRADNYIIDGIMSGLTYDESRDYKEDKWESARIQNWLNSEKERREAERKGMNITETVIGPRIIEGVQGEVREDLKRLEGLRKTEKGYSTISLDNKKAEYEKALETIKNLSTEEVKAIQDYLKYEEYIDNQAKSKNIGKGEVARALMTSGRALSIPSGYAKYKEAIKNYNKAKAAYDEELAFLGDIESKYSHLGRDIAEAVAIGYKLEDTQEKQAMTSFPLNLEEGKYNKVRAGIANIINSFPEKTIENSGVLEEVETGNKVSLADTKDIMSDTGKGITIKVSGGNNPELRIIKDHKEYRIKNVQQITQYNKDLKVVNDYLKDFININPNNINYLSNEDIATVYQGGIGALEDLANRRIKTENVPNSRYKSAVFYNRSSNEYVKVLLDYKGNIIAENMLSSELDNGGTQRDSYFINMASMGLQKIPGLVANDPD